MITEVLVNGHFATMHADHVRLFEFASRFGLVTVAINNDEWAERKYGKGFVSLTDRAYLLRSCRYVHNVVVFNEETPAELILQLKPRVIVKGPDYKDKELSEQWAIDRVRAKLVFRPGENVHSSSQILQVAQRKRPPLY
jgi:D-beta-D-heptose 7-phosphate kinase / D-beta-D-heptose 1-phosphate adenosyltransferase